jgi:hypothetical protein
LKHFKAAFLAVNNPSMVIISNQGKGLEAAVPTCLLLAAYYHYVHHLCNNVMEKFYPGSKARKLFWKAVYAPLESLYTTYLKEINMINAAAGQYLRGIPAEMWAQYAIRNLYFAHVTSNIVESTNGAWALDIYKEPILQALDRIWTILMEKFYTCHMRKFRRSQDFTDWA